LLLLRCCEDSLPAFFVRSILLDLKLQLRAYPPHGFRQMILAVGVAHCALPVVPHMSERSVELIE
jgi:hypothetical protein